MQIFKKYGDVWSEGFEEGRDKERAIIAAFLDRESEGMKSILAKTTLQLMSIRIRTGDYACNYRGALAECHDLGCPVHSRKKGDSE
jgi:hypothetical protein